MNKANLRCAKFHFLYGIYLKSFSLLHFLSFLSIACGHRQHVLSSAWCQPMFSAKLLKHSYYNATTVCHHLNMLPCYLLANNIKVESNSVLNHLFSYLLLWDPEVWLLYSNWEMIGAVRHLGWKASPQHMTKRACGIRRSPPPITK